MNQLFGLQHRSGTDPVCTSCGFHCVLRPGLCDKGRGAFFLNLTHGFARFPLLCKGRGAFFLTS